MHNESSAYSKMQGSLFSLVRSEREDYPHRGDGGRDFNRVQRESVVRTAGKKKGPGAIRAGDGGGKA